MKMVKNPVQFISTGGQNSNLNFISKEFPFSLEPRVEGKSCLPCHRNVGTTGTNSCILQEMSGNM